MAIEVGIKPVDQDIVVPLGLILPDAYASFSDYSDNRRMVLSAHCLANDAGGSVYRFDNEDFPEIDVFRVLPLDLYEPKNRIAEIPLQGSFEKDIVLESRRKGRLILKHTLNPSGESQHGLIAR